MQWILSSLTNNPEQLARFAGMAKGVLAGGIATSFGTEAAGFTQLKVVAYNFTLQALGILCMTYVCWRCVTATNHGSEKTIAPSASLEVPGEKEMEVRQEQQNAIA